MRKLKAFFCRIGWHKTIETVDATAGALQPQALLTKTCSWCGRKWWGHVWESAMNGRMEVWREVEVVAIAENRDIKWLPRERAK